MLNNLVAWAFTTGKVFLKSDGSAWRPLVHIEDISRAFLAVLEAPRDQTGGPPLGAFAERIGVAGGDLGVGVS